LNARTGFEWLEDLYKPTRPEARPKKKLTKKKAK
jgi:hypothetical protein